MDLDGCMLASWRLEAAAHSAHTTLRRSAALHAVNAGLNGLDPGSFSYRGCWPLYIAVYHIMQSESRGLILSAAQWLRTPSRGARVAGTLGATVFGLHFLCGMPAIWEGREFDWESSAATALPWYHRAFRLHVLPDLAAFVGLITSLAACSELRFLEYLGERCCLGTYVFHGFFTRSMQPCAELGTLGVKEGCGRIDLIFSGLCLGGVELVPTPAKAVILLGKAFGEHGQLATACSSQGKSPFRDLSVNLVLWTYPLLFMCTVGTLSQAIVMGTRLHLQGVISRCKWQPHK